MAQKKKEKMSFSKLSTYDGCPFHYYLKYSCGNYIWVDSPAVLYGSLCHYILEKEANCIKNGEPIDYDELEEIFTKTKKTSVGSKDKEQIIAIDEIAKRFPEEWNSHDTKSGLSYAEKAKQFIVEGFYRFPQYMEDHPELEIVGAEVPFEFCYADKYVFNGFIDLVMRYRDEPNHFIIWDIKTKDHEFTKQETTTPLQFVFYCKALRQKYGEDITIDCFYSLPVIDVLQPAGTSGFETRGEAKIQKLIGLIEEREWKPKPSPLCYWCEFCDNNPNITEKGKNLCCYYSLWTPNDKNFKPKMEWKGMDKHFIQMKKFLALQAIDEAIDDDDFEI